MVAKIDPRATIPSRGSDGSVGYDLYSVDTITIEPQTRTMISTGIKVKIPRGHYGRIAPRSGYAFKYGIDVLAGVIDPDYEGEIRVILYNTSKNVPFEVSPGQRIAQLIIEKCSTPDVFVMTETQLKIAFETQRPLNGGSVRGDGGFGSTGTH